MKYSKNKIAGNKSQMIRKKKRIIPSLINNTKTESKNA